MRYCLTYENHFERLKFTNLEHQVSFIVRCPHFRVLGNIWDQQKCPVYGGVLNNSESVLIEGFNLKEAHLNGLSSSPIL